MGYTSSVMPRLRVSLLAIFLLFISISIRADDDPSMGAIEARSHYFYKECDNTIFTEDCKTQKIYENIVLFWPAENESYQNEIRTANVQNLIVDIINTGTVKEDALVTIVVDYVNEDSFTRRQAGSPMYSFLVNDVCKSLDTYAMKKSSYNPFVLLSNGIFEFLRTRKSIDDDYADRIFPRPKDKVVDTISLMINFLSTVEYARSKYDYDYGFELLDTFFRNKIREERGPSEYTSLHHSVYDNAIFVPVFHGENYFKLFNKINIGNMHTSHNNLVNMGFYDNNEYEEIDVNRYSRNNGFLFHRGASIKDLWSHSPSNYDRVGPMWCPNVKYTGKYDNNRLQYSAVNQDIMEKIFIKSDSTNARTIEIDRFRYLERQNGKLIKYFNYTKPGVYSPLNHMINSFNESKDILGAVEDITYNQCFNSGVASTLASDLIVSYGPSKVITYSIGRFENPSDHSPINRNYDISQASLLRAGCPSLVYKPDSLISALGNAMCTPGNDNYDRHDTAFCFSFDNAYATAVEAFKHTATTTVSDADHRVFNVYIDESGNDNTIFYNDDLQNALLSYLTDVSNPLNTNESDRFNSLLPTNLQGSQLLIDPHNICYKSNGSTYKASKVY